MMLDSLRAIAKYHFAPLLYRYPPIGLEPSELAIYICELLNRADVPGDVAEVGCSSGGTACLAARALKHYAPNKTYTCFDTFNGFVPEHFEADAKIGTPSSARHTFSHNSMKMVRRILDMHGCDHVELVAGDIATIPDCALRDRYSVVLCDVDLAIPTYAALKRFYARLSPGGIILIDDCRQDPGQRWKAFAGVEQFCVEFAVSSRMRCGFAVIEK